MKKSPFKTHFFILSIVVLLVGCQEAPATLIDTYSDTNFFPKSIIALEEGGCIVATGYENVIRLNDNPTDDSTKVIWKQQLPELRMISIVEDDKDFIIVGEKQVVKIDSSSGEKKYSTKDYLKCVKLSENGEVLWQLEDNSMDNVEVIDIIALENGDFALIGMMHSLPTDTLRYEDLFVFKINSDGEVLWKNILNNIQPDKKLLKAFKTAEGDLKIVGSRTYNDAVIRTSSDSMGSMIYFLEIDTTGKETASSEHRMKDIFGKDKFDQLYLNIHNFKVLEHSDSDSDGGYTVLLERFGSSDFWAVRFNNNHSVLWHKTLDWEKYYSPNDIVAINDNRFIITAAAPRKDGHYLNLIGLNSEMDIVWSHKTKMNNRFSFGHAISKGNNNDIYVTIGDEHGDFLVGGTVRGENFSENAKQSYNRDMFSEMAVYHFQLTETAGR